MTAADISPDVQGNARAYSVSELAFALKRTLEDSYGYVRLRGELSKVTRHASGHCYLSIKDDKACIDGVVWKGQVRGLQVQPEQGLEVIVTGRITTYPASSKYQIVIESMEAAGVGALLAQLERLKARLQAEGLFDPSRKRPLPTMPATIGVITSPTGAVIRDILHRIRDRWPCRVIVWPVVVQGEAASAQVAAAIRGFNAMQAGGRIGRPDLLIVARGGGSVEDLWPFNDEALARTVAEGTIPLISAVGHETDTTLIDFVSDRRAPTPTAAAEMATPVLSELKAAVADYQRRMVRCAGRGLEERRAHLTAAARGLPRPQDLLAQASQRHDLASGRLAAALERNTALHRQDLVRVSSRLSGEGLLRDFSRRREALGQLGGRIGSALQRNVAAHRSDLTRTAGRLNVEAVRRGVDQRRATLDQAGRRLQTTMVRVLAEERAEIGRREKTLADAGRRMRRAIDAYISQARERYRGLDKLRQSLDPDRPLERGFARVTREDGAFARSASELRSGERVTLHFARKEQRSAVIDGQVEATAPKPQEPHRTLATRQARPRAVAPGQGDLF